MVETIAEGRLWLKVELHGTPKTPSEWFSQKFPKQASVYGAPMLEQKYSVMVDGDTITRTRPIQLNDDFFAGILGGDSGFVGGCRSCWLRNRKPWQQLHLQ